MSGVFEHATDRPGGSLITQEMVLSGQIGAPDFLQFIAERADWLSISGWAMRETPTRVVILAHGPEAMVGALEMAVMLGPLNVLVEEVAVREVGDPVRPGTFELRNNPEFPASR